ncbi:MAG: ATP-binding cassette domain-containing protein [Ardenticatenia bacterium]|nr:ATP-binding cassette domain-containing protein [Ardenticatenia bacterium]
MSDQKRVETTRITEELREMSRQLADAFRALAGSEEAQKLREELADGLKTLAKEAEELAEKLREREEAQKLREQAGKLAESIKSGEAARELQEELAEALHAVNVRLGRWVEALRARLASEVNGVNSPLSRRRPRPLRRKSNWPNRRGTYVPRPFLLSAWPALGGSETVAAPAILLDNVHKWYGPVPALCGLDVEVRQGEIFGFLGPNGAGKTTTIRCLLDFIRPQQGIVRVLGMNVRDHSVEIRAQTGYLPGELHLDDRLTPAQHLRLFNRVRGNRADWSYVTELAERLHLDLDRPIHNLSLGNKQKVGLIQALMHRPRLLVMDEPTTGLDPLMQREVFALLREARDAGTTVFFSSHIMSEVELLAERVAIIRQGRVVEVATTDALVHRALRRVFVRFREPVDLEPLTRLPGVVLLDQRDGSDGDLTSPRHDGRTPARTGRVARGGRGHRAPVAGRGLSGLLHRRGGDIMWTVFIHHVSRLRGMVLGWGISLGFMGAIVLPFYADLDEQRALLEELLRAYPPELLAFFGGNARASLLTPEGFLHLELFSYLPLLLGIFALLAGSGLISADEEQGRLDLFLALPIRRAQFYAARLAAFGVATATILALIGAGVLVGQMISGLSIRRVGLVAVMVDQFSVLMVVGTLALALSQVTPSRRSAAMITGIVVVGSFFLNGFSELNEDLRPFARLLPLYYAQGGDAFSGVRWDWLAGKLAVAALLAGIGVWRFQRRDLRVSGEGTWFRLPARHDKPARTAPAEHRPARG